MHWLYLVLKDHKECSTADEITIAAGQKILDPTSAAEYLLQLEKASTNLVNVFKQQSQQAAVSFYILTSPPFPWSCFICYRTKSGTKKNLRIYLQNGWWFVTNHSMKSINPNFDVCLNILIPGLHLISYTATQWKDVSWRWVRIQFRELRKWFRQVVTLLAWEHCVSDWMCRSWTAKLVCLSMCGRPVTSMASLRL